MSVIQSRLPELRYIKRTNLDEEAKVIGNYYRDIIRSFGVDCNYYKLSTNYPVEFTTELSQNNFILNAYGYEPDPNFSISAEMITYMEVENDIFNLNKYGIIPDMNVNFYFDSVDFAAALATKIGVLKEFPIKSQILSLYLSGPELSSNEILSVGFDSNILSGIAQFQISNIVEGMRIGEHSLSAGMLSANSQSMTDVNYIFPVNDVIYASFNHKVWDSAPEGILVNYSNYKAYKWKKNKYDTSKVLSADEISSFNEDDKYLFVGDIKGTILFHGLDKISKYTEKIVPNVGDIITIDFPDEHNREQFQITEALDKNLSPDGQNPLLHKYYWKCKAKRYVNDHENFPEQNDANKQLDEKLDIINHAASDVTEKIETYPDEEDNYYGGYGTDILSGKDDVLSTFTDITVIPNDLSAPGYINPEDIGETIEVLQFGNGSSLRTDGMDLFFQPSGELSAYLRGVTTESTEGSNTSYYPPSQFQFIKATDDHLIFFNVEGEAKMIIGNPLTEDEKNLLLLSLKKISQYIYGHKDLNPIVSDTGIFHKNFLKFSNCKTYLVSIGSNLYCKLGNAKDPINITK